MLRRFLWAEFLQKWLDVKFRSELPPTIGTQRSGGLAAAHQEPGRKFLREKISYWREKVVVPHLYQQKLVSFTFSAFLPHASCESFHFPGSYFFFVGIILETISVVSFRIILEAICSAELQHGGCLLHSILARCLFFKKSFST